MKDAITEIAYGYGLDDQQVAELRRLMAVGRFNESDPSIITAIMMIETHKLIRSLDARLKNVETALKNG